MKKEGVIALLIILLIPNVFATLSVSLTSPSSGNTTNSTSIYFVCTATDDTYAISSIALYMNTSSSPWAVISTQSNASTTANFLITSLSQGGYIWNCVATNSNTNTATASSNNSLTISTLAFSGIIPNQSITEDTNSSNLFDLDTYFTGVSYYTFSGNNSILFIIDGDNKVSISPSANFTGSQNVTITGVYGSSSISSNEILINVTNVNDAPLLTSHISNITLDTNANTSLDMTNYFTDIDSNTTLTYSISTSHISLLQSNDTVKIIPETDWQGTENATITASDGIASITSNSFEIIVGSGSTTNNNAPTIDSYSPESDPVIEVNDTQDFSITSSDSDGDTITTAWYVNDVDQGVSENTFSYTPTTEGVYTIKVSISDGTNEATHSWSLTIGSPVVTVNSILTTQSSSAVCGNTIVEEGETCSTCALDVLCAEGSICNNGVCEKTKSATGAIFTLAIGSILILFAAILVYYFTTLKKSGKRPESTTFQYTPTGASPPADYTDFYKSQK